MADYDPLDIRQINMMIDGFMETFAEPFFENSAGQRAALVLAKERGRQDIIERIEAPARRREAERMERERELAEQEETEDERAEYERLKAKYDPSPSPTSSPHTDKPAPSIK